jgi:site-specific recombinase XerD
MNTPQRTPLGIALHGFFYEYLPQLKGASAHTIHSYRDSLKLFLRFLAHDHDAVNTLSFETIDVNAIIKFLNYLETKRHNSTGTRNVRLAAIHSLFRYVASRFPEYLHLSQQVLSIPFKRTRLPTIDYFEFEELTALLNEIDRSTPDGQRDYVLLTLMFNTGARVQEIVNLKANDLQLCQPPSVRLLGKGQKERICPIWTNTARALQQYIEARGIDLKTPMTVFNNHLGTPLTRFGIGYILSKYVHKAAKTHPHLKTKRLHPHSIRHSTAVYLLKSGVDLDSIAHWLGHASPNTTYKYATIDLDMKRKTIAKASPPQTNSEPHISWRNNPDILSWLESL